MDNFSRQPDPMRKRIVDSASVYIVVAALLVIATLWFIRKHHQEEMASRVQFLKGGPVIADRQIAAPAPAVPQNPHPNPTIPESPTNAAQPESPKVDETKKVESAETIKVKILYAEVDRDTMEMLRAESMTTQQHTDFGDFKAGALPAKVHPSRERGVRVLERVEQAFDVKTPSKQWFTGTKGSDEAENLGLTTLLSVERPPAANGALSPNIKGEIEILRAFREGQDPSEPPVQRNYPSTSFDLSPGMTWMVNLRLPTQPQEEPGQTSEGLMRIFNSPQYKSRQTEFTIFFEFDTPAPNSSPGKN